MTALQSSVSSVVVFQRGATVTRSATADAVAGVVAFEGLPLCLDDESIRITLADSAVTAGWSVADVQVEVQAPVREAIPEPEDDQALAEAEDAEARARALLDSTRASIEAMRKVELGRRLSEDKDHRPSHDPTQGRLAWLKVQADAFDGLQAELAQRRKALDEAAQALRTVLDAKAARSSDRDPRAFEPRKVVRLRLVGEGSDAAVPIELSYRVPGARWAPSYMLRLGRETEATLELRAVVAQRTGEDWRGARLTVSTASWQAWHDLPRLDARRVGRMQATPMRAGWREPPPNPESLYADYDRVVARLPKPELTAAMVGGGGPPPAKLAKPKKRPAPRRAEAPIGPPAAMAPPGAGAAPPPPRPAPAPAPQPQAEMRRSRARMKSKPAADATLAGGPMPLAEDPFGSPPEPPEPAVGLRRDWFDYGRLRLPMPFESGRGRLHRVRVSNAPAAEKAGRIADALAPDALPAGHAWVRAKPGHAYAYACDAAVDIPSDGVGHVVTVLDAELSTARSHVCVPGVSADVFRTLAARNPLDRPLPAGPLDVYEGDAFVLTGSLDATAAGGRFEVGLGVEQSIKVARNVSFTEDTEGLIKKSNAYEHQIVIDVQNLLPIPAAVEIRERVPVAASDEEDIEVMESEVEPPWDVYKPKGDPLEGGRRWRVEVAAASKTTLRTTWTIRVPGGRELVGGNRREA